MANESLFPGQSHYVTIPEQQHPTLRRRRMHKSVAFLLLIGCFFSGLGIQLARLQLIQGEYHRVRAENNRLRLIPVPAKRGQILDRNGFLLAGSQLSRSVYLWPQEQSPQQWKITAQQLQSILKVPASEILEKLEKTGYRSRIPVRVSPNLSPGMFIGLAEKVENLRGVEVRGESRRSYPNGNLLAHILGYIGEATSEELKANPDYPMGMMVGKMGIEKLANSKIQGVWGNRLIEVDAKGQEIQELGLQSPKQGESMGLTVDLALQKTAEKALANRRGAVVVLDVKTGGILALTSGPTFDPNLFTDQVTSQEWKQLQGAEQPLLNRALQGYPPGSTFKIVTTTAGIESRKFSLTSKLATASAIKIGGIAFHEHGNGYGVIGFKDALAFSSNTFFYQVGMKTGPENIAKWGKELGIAGTINLDLLGLDGANHGQIPTPKEKEKLYGEPWYVGDTVTMAIGQGLVLVTPLELAVMISTVANNGWRVQPHLLMSQTNTSETKPMKTKISASTLNLIRAGLIDVVKKGTGRGLNDGTIPLTGGKTGTVEIPGQPDNAMYVGFGPANKPEIAIAVVVEAGGYGAVSAAPIAHDIFKTYFSNRNVPTQSKP
ncbi:penicillin-binding protein 2 [Planktothrix sp. FACHB-1365]|uniref:penicillin-binding protein 2 n=1 Tax=Planktothrix sp. FACHB-1365 TaxID=2692855 RepID=UPI001683E220|nr:penicillin-binding protein 2 [Planktothrix sp. FACHB-1365]MBD2482245.1 penicillin-binding protein 2 [Planktothrix sp. FACHB-1365]